MDYQFRSLVGSVCDIRFVLSHPAWPGIYVIMSQIEIAFLRYYIVEQKMPVYRSTEQLLASVFRDATRNCCSLNASLKRSHAIPGGFWFCFGFEKALGLEKFMDFDDIFTLF